MRKLLSRVHEAERRAAARPACRQDHPETQAEFARRYKDGTAFARIENDDLKALLDA
jgi:hypothetical protein